MKTRTKRGWKWFPLLVGVCLALAAGGLLLMVLFSNEVFPEYSPAHRGLLLAREAGCFSCHGEGGQQGSPNPARDVSADRFGTVPSIFDERLPDEEIRQWISNGITHAKGQSEAFMKSRENSVLKMPAFSKRFSEAQVADLSAYVALMQYRASRSGQALSSKGEQLAREYACFSCHGELGQGGIENPGSLKGYIPGFFGNDFRALTQNGNRKDVYEWIHDGFSGSFINQGFAGFYPGRFFSERQTVNMPAYKEVLSKEEISLLVDFLLELLEAGPLTAKSLLAYRPLVDSAPVTHERGSPVPNPAGSPGIEDRLFTEVSDILQQNCLKCHGPEKQRSSYRLDSQEAALRGGEIAEFLGQAAIEPGASSKSLLIRFIRAEEEDPMQEIYPMPSGDNPRLSADQIKTLEEWVDAGASWPSGRTLKLNKGNQ